MFDSQRSDVWPWSSWRRGRALSISTNFARTYAGDSAESDPLALLWPVAIGARISQITARSPSRACQMASAEKSCPHCGAPISYRKVSLGVFPPRVTCPSCGRSVGSVRLGGLPPYPFLVAALALGLVVGILFGAAITLLSQEWSYTARFSLLGGALVGGAIVVASSRNLLHR